MAKRTFKIDDLIVNTPFEEPSRYGRRDGKMFELVEGERRPASYTG